MSGWATSPAGGADAPALVIPVDGDSVPVAAVVVADGEVRARVAGSERRWPLADVVAVRLQQDLSGRVPASPAGARLAFANGDVLGIGDTRAGTADALEVTGRNLVEAGQPLAVPVAALSGVAFDAPADNAAETRLTAWLAKRRDGDAALFRNFDETAASFAGYDRLDVKFERQGKPLTLPRDRVLAVAFDATLADPALPPGPLAVARLRDGSRVTLSAVAYGPAAANDKQPKATPPADATLRGVLPGGVRAAFPGAEVVEFAVRGGRATSLADATPLRVERQAFLDLPPPEPRRGANVRGGPLTLDGRVFASGWGAGSGCRMVFATAGAKRFECWVGVDDAAGPLAQTRFAVELDGKPAYDSGPMSAGDPPKFVRLELGAARELALTTDFARRGDIDDLANWCDARLVK